MKLFSMHDPRRAVFSHVGKDGQALQITGEGRARLYDANLGRLVDTARRCGMVSVRVVLTGMREQHVEIEGAPLDRALAETQQSVAS